MSVNQIDSNGIQTKTMADIISALTSAFQSIYGSDVNLAQNSPDGQLLYQIALICYDHGSFVQQDYSSKDPDQAVGVALDAVSQYCGITRRGGTYTEVDVVVTADRSLNLNGQDTSTPFTITDATGNQFQLIATASLSSGANTLSFRAKNIGDVQVSLNTLTVITTPVLGVVSVNNPTAPTQQGADQETDAALRLRRQASVGKPAQNAISGMKGAILELDGVSDVEVLENITDVEDADGIPAHGIWVIAKGGDSAEIAEIIDLYRMAGIPMAGSVTEDVEQADGSTIEIAFDEAVAEDLYIEFTATSKSGGAIDEAALKADIAEALTYSIYETADVSSIIAAIYAINPDVVVSLCGVSDTDGSYATTKAPTEKKNYWNVTAAKITIS